MHRNRTRSSKYFLCEGEKDGGDMCVYVCVWGEGGGSLFYFIYYIKYDLPRMDAGTSILSAKESMQQAFVFVVVVSFLCFCFVLFPLFLFQLQVNKRMETKLYKTQQQDNTFFRLCNKHSVLFVFLFVCCCCCCCCFCCCCFSLFVLVSATREQNEEDKAT